MIDPARIQSLVPLNTLSEENLKKLAKRLDVENFVQGAVICKQRDSDPETLYLLKGQVSLTAESTTMRRYISADTDEAQFAIADQPPRPYTITADTDCEIVRIGNYELDRAVMFDEVATTITKVEGARESTVGDTTWLANLARHDAFRKLSSEKLAALLMRLEPRVVKRGDVVIHQNDMGDTYFIVKAGRFSVVRNQDGKQEVLNELGEGSVFGEESLISGAPRNASVVAATDGILMRLGRADFETLLKAPLLSYVTSPEAAKLVKVGARILDVRPANLFAKGALKGAFNIPVAELRDRMSELDPSKRLVICCHTGHMSEVAAFLLAQRGFDVAILKGGLRSLVANK